MRTLSGIAMLFFASFNTMAQVGMQPGWNWPQDEDMRKQAMEKQAYYKVLMQTDKLEESLKAINWLFENTPDLHESIYQDGSKIIDNVLEIPMSDERKSRLEDSLLWTYDMRIKYFDNDASAVDRKAYTAFKRYYKNASKYALLRKLYQELYAYPASDISQFNLTPYMTMATYYYKSEPKEFTALDVLEVHTNITTVIDKKIANGENKAKLIKEQDKVDAFLSSLGSDLISCEFIEENLVAKFEADPSNMGLAKKVFSYSLTAKCTDKPYFLAAGETYFTEEPSFSLAKALADKFYFAKEYDKSMKYYSKMEELASDSNEQFEGMMGQASTEVKLGNKVKARALARKALSVKPNGSEAYNLIGNLYFLSYENCKEGESKVADRAVFIAAYEMYKKAGNTSQMNAAKEQFPSIEDIFTENREEGEKITVDCWINETVSLQRR